MYVHKKWYPIIWLILLLPVLGCSVALPMTSTVNDFVLLGIKANNEQRVDFRYSSEVTDGKIHPFTHTQATTFEVMIHEYMQNKFVHLTPDAETVIEITLAGFVIRAEAIDSVGKQVVSGLFGAKSNYKLTAKVEVHLSVIREEDGVTKTLTGTAESTLTAKSDDNTAFALAHGRNVNNANNKILMLLNAYFEELGL